jgi:hypothetical protein
VNVALALPQPHNIRYLNQGLIMREFLRNWILLTLLALALIFIIPDAMRQIFGAYNSLGFLSVSILMVILAALPHRLRRRYPA